MTDKEARIAELEQRIEELERVIEKLVAEKQGIANVNKSESPVVAGFDFSDEACRRESGWKICNAEKIESDTSLCFSTIQVERTLGVFYDPMLVKYDINVPIDDIKQVHVRLKSNVDASQKCMMRVFFTTEKHLDWSQSKSIYNYYPAGRTYDVYVDTRNRYWNGKLTGLRIDPVEGLCGSIEIELVELIDSMGNVKYREVFSCKEAFEKSGWELKNASLVSYTGKLSFNVDLLEKKRVYTDPFIVNGSLCIEASKVKYIHVKLRADIESPNTPDVYMQILFKTQSSNFWTQDKSMRFSYTPCEDIDAYIEVKQLFWKGQIIALRIDPFEVYEGRVEIKLVELLSEIPSDGDINMLEARTRHLEDRFNKIYN